MDFSQIVPALPGLWEGMLTTLQLMILGVLGFLWWFLPSPFANR